MVATENGTRLTDMELRHAVERVMEMRDWNSMRTAVEIGCTESTLTKWLENSHETAMTVFRGKLVRFARTFDAPVAEPPAPVESELGPTWNADELVYPVDAPLPVTGTTAITITRAEQAEAEVDAERFDRLDADDGHHPLVPLSPRPGKWTLPAGFTLIRPTASTATRPPGITIAKDYDRATLSKRLFHDELQCPTHVIVATNGPELIIVQAAEGDEGAMRLSKAGDVSNAVARYVETIKRPPGFYRATEDPNDGSWHIRLTTDHVA